MIKKCIQVQIPVISALLSLTLLPFLLSNASADVTAVATEGQQAPGEPVGINYYGFGGPVIAPDGTIAFSAIVTPAGQYLPQTQIAYIGTPSPLNVVSLQGTRATGAPAGILFTTCDVTELGNNGMAVGQNYISGPGLTSSAIFAGHVGDWNAYAYQGLVAPGTGGLTYNGDFFSPSINASGQVAFMGYLNGGVSGGVFAVADHVVTNVAVSGMPAPGVANTFFQFYASPLISDSGKIVFTAETGSSGNVGQTGIWAGTPGALQLIAYPGTPAPGAGNGALFSVVSSSTPSINRSGQIAFRAALVDDGPINVSNDSGIWSNIGGVLQPIVRAGDQAVGLPVGTTFAEFNALGNGSSAVLNDSGQFAFVADLVGDGSANSAIFLGKPGAYAPIIVAGQSVPGLPAGDSLTDFDSLNLNDAGQMFFRAHATGPDVNPSFDTALVTYDPILGLQLIAMSDVVTPGIGVAPSTVYIEGNNNGYQSPSLSDSGQFVYSGLYSDGYRILTGTVPEPGAAMLSLLATILLFTRRRPRQIEPPT